MGETLFNISATYGTGLSAFSARRGDNKDLTRLAIQSLLFSCKNRGSGALHP
jgi:hypothetical protein